MGGWNRGTLGIAAIAGLACGALLAPQAGATVTAYLESDPAGPWAVASAMMAAGAVSQLTGADWVEYPPILPPTTPCPAPGGDGFYVDPDPSPAGVSTEEITPLFGPPDFNGFGILSSGFAAGYMDDDPSYCYGSTVRGGYDVVILRLDLMVPAGHNCLSFSFQFLSEEFPKWVGSEFNDAFVAELGTSTWTSNAPVINAPDNFAFVVSGTPATVNSLGFAGMSAWRASPTTYGGASDRLVVKSPIAPGPESVFLSVFDAGDSVLDSAVFIDDLRTSTVASPDVDCVPGIGPAPQLSHPVYRFETTAVAIDCSSTTMLLHDASWGAPDALEWTWDFGDGSTGNGQQVEHEFTNDGWHQVTLTIWDGAAHHDVSALVDVQFESCQTVGPPEPDSDWDGVIDSADNCPGTSNRDQADMDADGLGDACDDSCEAASGCETGTRNHSPRAQATKPDQDHDGVPDARDVCPATPDADQANLDADPHGDACDPDADGDGVLDHGAAGLFSDNCLRTANPGQLDADDDGLGDACDVAATTLQPGAPDRAGEPELHGLARPVAAAPGSVLLLAIAALALAGRRRVK